MFPVMKSHKWSFLLAACILGLIIIAGSPAVAGTVVVDITAQNIAFNLSTITVPAGSTVIVHLNNLDNFVPHTFSVYTDSSASSPIFQGSAVTGPAIMTYTFTAPATPGTYFFRCDIHPVMMNGQFIVTSTSPTPTPTPTSTITQTPTPSPSPSPTPTPTPTPTITQTPTPSPSPSPTPTPTPTPTITQTPTPSPSPSPTPTPTPTSTITPIPTPTPVPGLDTLQLQPGWNFVSTPGKLQPGHDTGIIFRNIDTDGHTIWLYDSEHMIFTPVLSDTPILPLYGIWIYSRTTASVQLFFDQDTNQPPATRSLFQGWNAIGFTGPIPATARDTLISVRDSWTQAMGFDAYNQQYEIQMINGASDAFSDSRLMNPGKGYWLYMRGPGDLTATGSPVGKADLTNRNSPEAATFTTYPSITTLHNPQQVIGLKMIAGGFNAPMMITSPDDQSGRTFVVDQTGVVWVVFPNGTVSGQPFLDIRDRMVALNKAYDERGLLSIAFHPDYASNGRVFAYYSAPLRPGGPAGYSCTNRLSEFHVSATDPDKVDMSSERVILEVDKPQMNHNGGTLLFGPDDGYLYLPLGDGGAADDRGLGHNPDIGNAQDLTRILGKLIRIDVDHTSPGRQYAIPADNPFLSNSSILPEIYAYGLRNPAFATVDSGPGHHMVIAMAGQHLFESVLVVYRGADYPWNIREGTHGFNPANDTVPLPEPRPITGYSGQSLVGPVVELGHDLGIVVVGGTVYRGTMFPEWQGRYLFGTWSDSFSSGNGTLLVATPVPGPQISQLPYNVEQLTPEVNSMWATSVINVVNNPDNRLHSFVRGVFEGPDHEAYVLINYEGGPGLINGTGSLWQIVPPSTPRLIQVTQPGPAPTPTLTPTPTPTPTPNPTQTSSPY